MQDDGFDRRVVAKFLELPHNGLRRENDAVEIDHANAIPEPAESGLSAGSMQRQINQSKDGQHEEEKCSAANQNPEQCARTSL